jgi:hypothetical protein
MQKPAAVPGTLSVTGEGQVKAKPDVATINLGVLTTSKRAQDAVAENARRMTQVIDRMKKLGVPAKDLQTLGFNISPVVDYDEKSPNFGQIIEYRVEATLSVRAEVDMAGPVLDEGVSAGANVAGSLSFGLRNDTAQKTQALKAAVQAARRDADTVAEAMGMKIKGSTTIDVQQGGAPIIIRSLMRADSAPRTTFEPGSLTISATVRIVFTY